MRIVYMGTPEFAIHPLNALIQEGYEISGIITAPDKPSGRGKHLRPSPVKEFALKKGLKILQPVNLKDPAFLEDLKKIGPDLQIVVAFRMLPREVWKMPKQGTFNLHASLLPQYRGAAPINHVIINGEEETGLTTFFIDQEIDTGKIIFRESTSVGKRETAGELHDRLMMMGAELVVKTVRSIEAGNIHRQDQQELIEESVKLKTAPKIGREDCRIDWTRNVKEVDNFIRGLSPYPTAFSTMQDSKGVQLDIKIYFSEPEELNHSLDPGTIILKEKNRVSVAAGNGLIHIKELQLPGKKKLDCGSFLRGFQGIEEWKFISPHQIQT